MVCTCEQAPRVDVVPLQGDAARTHLLVKGQCLCCARILCMEQAFAEALQPDTVQKDITNVLPTRPFQDGSALHLISDLL